MGAETQRSTLTSCTEATRFDSARRSDFGNPHAAGPSETRSLRLRLCAVASGAAPARTRIGSPASMMPSPSAPARHEPRITNHEPHLEVRRGRDDFAVARASAPDPVRVARSCPRHRRRADEPGHPRARAALPPPIAGVPPKPPLQPSSCPAYDDGQDSWLLHLEGGRTALQKQSVRGN